MTQKDARTNPLSQELLFLKVIKMIWRSFIFESSSSWILYCLWHRICMCVCLCECVWENGVAFSGNFLFCDSWSVTVGLSRAILSASSGRTSKYSVYTWGSLIPRLPCHKNVASFLVVFMDNIVGDGIIGEGWVQEHGTCLYFSATSHECIIISEQKRKL